MRATSEVLEDNKVKIAVAIDEDEVEAGMADAAKALARQVRIPGFRPGRAPRQVVEARIGGPKALRDEALRELLPDFYARAVSATEVEPISSPELSVTGGQEEGPVEFEAIVEVRPSVCIVGYGALRVTIPSPLATDAELEQLLDNLRDTDAVLEEVTRPVVTGDYVTVDVRGFDLEGTQVVSVDDYVYVVGQGTFVDTADEQFPGTRPGDRIDVTGTAPGGDRMRFELELKEVKEKVLPELTDEWVAENSEYATAQELRDAYLERIHVVKLGQARRAMRDATLGELASQVGDDEAPESLVDAETRERFEDLRTNLARQNVGIEEFLTVTHQTPEQLIEALRLDALRAVKVDLALRAVAAEEQLDVDEEALDAELETLSEGTGRSPGQLREELDRNGRLGALRSETAKRKAADFVLEHVTYVDETGSVIDRAALEEEAPEDATGDEPDDGPDAGDERVDQSGSEDETEEPT